MTSQKEVSLSKQKIDGWIFLSVFTYTGDLIKYRKTKPFSRKMAALNCNNGSCIMSLAQQPNFLFLVMSPY